MMQHLAGYEEPGFLRWEIIEDFKLRKDLIWFERSFRLLCGEEAVKIQRGSWGLIQRLPQLPQQQTMVVVGVDQSHRLEHKWMELECILKIELREFDDGYGKLGRKRSQDSSSCAIYWSEEDCDRIESRVLFWSFKFWHIFDIYTRMSSRQLDLWSWGMCGGGLEGFFSPGSHQQVDGI